MLEVRALRCERNGRVLFDDLTFDVASGQLVRIEGDNGSGKTTLLRALCGLYADVEGDIDWELPDYPVYIGHRPGVKDIMTALENLRWLCELYGQPKSTDELLDALDQFGLSAFADRPAGAMSEGQRKRVNLARLALLNAPAWILDEPFSAIDVAGVELLTAKIEAQLAGGSLVLLTSHQQVHTEAPTTVLRLGA